MRIWSLHPEYLDARGLVALWREALLAQAVLRGATCGYRHHPQLARFRRRRSPVGTIAEYLRHVHAEALARGYRFDRGRIASAGASGRIPVTRGQIEHEWAHLKAKLVRRDPARTARCEAEAFPAPIRFSASSPAGWRRGSGPASPADGRRPRPVSVMTSSSASGCGLGPSAMR